MSPRRSKRIKVAQEAAAASKPKGAKVAPKSRKGRAGTKGKSATKVNNHNAARSRGSKNNGEASKKSAQTAEPSSRGALKDLLEMPLDIICEVCPNADSRYNVGFSYLVVYRKVLYRLRPLDLLRVSRINKAFRDFLMRRSSMHVWMEARKNILGLPEPFPGMSEPAYASLCFDSLCQVGKHYLLMPAQY